MRKPNPVQALAFLPALLALAAPAALAEHPESYYLEQRIQRLAHEVADGAQLVYRSAAGHRGGHGRGHGAWRSRWGRGHGRYGHYRADGYTLRLLADLEQRARHFEHAITKNSLIHVDHDFEALARSFDRAAAALYRSRVSYATQVEFEHLAEHMFGLSRLFEEFVYANSPRYRPGTRGDGQRVQIYTPRWNVEWHGRGGRVYDRGGFYKRDRDWDSDSDSDSDSDRRRRRY